MKYFEITEVAVKPISEGFIVAGRRFEQTINNLIPTKGISIEQLRTILTIAMDSVENGEFVDKSEGVVIVREEPESKCGGNCQCNKPEVSIIDEIMDSITPEYIAKVKLDMENETKAFNAKKSKQKKSKIIKPVVNDALSKFQSKHKLID
jgi:hypothetical protein